jgi:hypothetical protein
MSGEDNGLQEMPHRIEMVYKDALDNLKFLKEQQWPITRYALTANRPWEQHQRLVCAHEHVAGKKPGENVYDQFDTVKLNEIGCSNSDDTVTVGEARNPLRDAARASRCRHC